MPDLHEFNTIVTKTFLRVIPEKVRNRLNAGDVANVQITVIKFSAEKHGEKKYDLEGSDTKKVQGV